jgi:cytochrome c556
MIVRAAVAAAVFAVGITAVVAQADVIKQRKDAMKAQENASNQLVRIARGQAPFDAAAVKSALQVFVDTSVKFADLFPANSKTGGGTEATPAVWDKMDDFKAKLAAFHKDAEASIASVKDVATLRAAMGPIARHCASCHETYRKS